LRAMGFFIESTLYLIAEIFPVGVRYGLRGHSATTTGSLAAKWRSVIGSNCCKYRPMHDTPPHQGYHTAAVAPPSFRQLSIRWAGSMLCPFSPSASNRWAHSNNWPRRSARFSQTLSIARRPSLPCPLMPTYPAAPMAHKRSLWPRAGPK